MRPSHLNQDKAKDLFYYKKKFVAAALLFLCITVSIPVTVMNTSPDIVLPPGNDQCVNAFKLKIDDDKTRKGTFQGASPDYGGAFCGPRGDPERNRVVWYKFQGTGDAVRVRIHALNKNVSVAIYHGDCNALLLGAKTNVTFGKEEATSDWIECNSPSAPVRTTKNHMYYIYVATCPDCDHFNNDAFIISVETATTSPPNNLCENALELPTHDGTVVNGTIHDTMWSSVLSELDFFGSGSFGVWYVVRGNGQILKFILQDYIDNVRLRIQLFTGTCNTLTFIRSEPGIPLGSNSTIAFAECSQEQECAFTPTEAGETYLVYVYTKDVYMYTLSEDEHSTLSFEISAQFL